MSAVSLRAPSATAAVTSRMLFLTQPGWLSGYLQFILFVLPSHFGRQVVLVSHGMFLSPWPPSLGVPTRQTE